MDRRTVLLPFPIRVTVNYCGDNSWLNVQLWPEDEGERLLYVTRTPAPIFAIKKPRMAVFAQPSNESFNPKKEQYFLDLGPRYPVTAPNHGQMNPVRYKSPQNPMMTGTSQSSMRTGQKFEPRVQESPCCPGQASTRVPLFQQRQNIASFQPRSAAVGKSPVQRYPPSTRGSQFPLQPPTRSNPVPLIENPDYKSRSTFSRGVNHQNKLTQVPDATDEAWGSTRIREDVAPTFAVERKTPDTSLRLLTTTIDGMKRWANLKDKTPLLFEVFGTVNSAVSGDSTTDAIQFLLKDSQATINCIFYQIDRTLQRLTRGQWYRCVGRYSGNSGSSFKCVSIRPIREAEKKHMKTLTAASERAMQALLQTSHEL